MGITSMIHLSMDIEIPSRIDACCNSHENVSAEQKENKGFPSWKLKLFVQLSVILSICNVSSEDMFDIHCKSYYDVIGALLTI